MHAIERLAEEQKRENALIAQVIEALAGTEPTRLVEALAALDFENSLWQRAFATAARLAGIKPKMQRAFTDLWVRLGEHIRQEVGNDLVLIAGLRAILPKYRGPEVTLYRGDSAENRRCRTYGLAWSSDRRVAESFALGKWRTAHGGSMLLRTTAPPDAILFAPPMLQDEIREHEYLVDRRRLGKVDVILRYSHIAPDDYTRYCEEMKRSANG